MKQNCNDLFKKAFSHVAPTTDNDSFERSVKERVEHMEKTGRHAKKPLIIALAAVLGISAATVSVGAVTGLIDFNEIFGHSIQTEDEALGSALVGTAENVQTTSSDSDYIVNLRGVTGTEYTVLANIEISRADGGRVEDYFINPLGDTNLEGFMTGACAEGENVIKARSSNCYVGENGSVYVNMQLMTDSGGSISEPQKITDRRMTINGSDFFPAANLFEYMSEKGVSYKGDNRDELGGGADAIAALLLDWSVEFTYIPSEASTITKGCAEQTETCEIYVYGVGVSNCTINSITLSSTSMIMRGSYADSDSSITENDIYVIKSDGTRINTTFSCGYSDGDSFSDEFVYCVSGLSDTIAIDLSDVTAVSINGVVYTIN